MMTSYEVSIWRERTDDQPDSVTTVEAYTPDHAMTTAMRTLGLRVAMKVEVRTAGGLLSWRWRCVLLLAQHYMFLMSGT